MMSEKAKQPEEVAKKVKTPPPGLVIPVKKAPLSKAERRAMQEAQRAAKGLSTSGISSSSPAETAFSSNHVGLGQAISSSSASNMAATQGSKARDSAPIATKHTSSQVTVQTTGGSISRRGSTVSADTVDSHSKAHSSSSGIAPLMMQPASLMERSNSSIASVLFSHLPAYKDPKILNREFSGIHLGGTNNSSLHSSVIHLGSLYASGMVRGANARCRAMLRTFQLVLGEYTRPLHVKDIRQDIDSRILKTSFQFWTQSCRTHSISMGNAFTFLKLALMSPQTRDLSEEQLKEYLHETIDAYIQERIEFADKAICEYAATKIHDHDVILTYGYSEVIQQLLIHAATLGHKSFRVICVDSRPLLEGRMLLESLVQENIPCTYVLMNALSYVTMKDVTKVFLGAAALTSNGAVISRVGTACVALMAQKASRNIPVLVCCETYKITLKVQLESITGNELGNPKDLLSIPCALDRLNVSVWTKDEENLANDERQYALNKNPNIISTDFFEGNRHLNLLNLLYDLTPSVFVSGIICEMGIVPPSSLAVILREMNRNQQENTSDIF